MQSGGMRALPVGVRFRCSGVIETSGKAMRSQEDWNAFVLSGQSIGMICFTRRQFLRTQICFWMFRVFSRIYGRNFAPERVHLQSYGNSVPSGIL